MNQCSTKKTCARCGTEIGPELDTTVCAACLLEAGLEESTDDGQAPSSDSPGKIPPVRFGQYELLEQIGRGGMGVIYKARQHGLDRIVALKMLLAGEFADPKARERLLREARTAASLAHPGIVTLHEVGEHNGLPFFAMEYVDGPNLAELCREGLLPVSTAVRYVEQLARAIHFAHEHGVIHRDLKPANVLIGAGDQPKLTDFGLTKSAADPTRTIENAGSPNFMAPEQADSALGSTGVPTDVYGLGAILYYLLSGHPPAAGETLAETLRAVAAGEPVAPRQLRPALPRDLETIALKCLEKEPPRRYRSALEVAEDLARWRNHEPIRARPVGMQERVRKWVRRRPIVAGLLAAVAVSLVGGFAATAWQARKAIAASRRSEQAAYYAKILGSMATKFEPSVREELRKVPVSLRGWEWGQMMVRCLPELFYWEEPFALEGISVSSNHRNVFCWGSGQARMLDYRSQADRADLGLPSGNVRTALFSPDANFIAVLYRDGRLLIKTLKDSSAPTDLLRAGEKARNFAFLKDSRSVVVVDVKGRVRQVEFGTGRVIREFQDAGLSFAEATPSTDGLIMLAIAARGNGPAYVRWQMVSGEKLPDRSAPPANALQTVLNAQGTICAQLLDSHRIEVRDTATGRLISSWSEPGSDLAEIALALDGKRLLVRSGNGRGFLIDASNGGLVGVQAGRTRQLVTAPQSKVALSFDSEFGYRGWDLETGVECGIFPVYPSPDSRAALTSDGVLSSAVSGHSVFVWLSYPSRWRTTDATNSTKAKIVALAHSPDSTRFASAHADGTLRIWNARSLSCVRRASDSRARFTALRWARNGEFLAAGNEHGRVQLLSAATLDTQAAWSAHHGAVQSLSIDSRSQWIATAGADGVGLWELPSGRMRWFHPWTNASGSVAFEPGGTNLFVASTEGRIWKANLRNGAPLAFANERFSGPPMIACGPETDRGRQIIVTESRYDALILDAAALKEQARFTAGNLPIQQIEFNPDGSRLAVVLAADQDDLETCRLSLWDTWTLQPALSLGEPGLRIKAASFSPDGLQLIAGGPNGYVQVWDALPWWHPSVEQEIGGQTAPVPERELSRVYWLKRLDAIEQGK